MLRLFDWLCIKCDLRSEGYVDVPHGETPPDTHDQVCPIHGVTPHDRTVSLPAPYTGEHVRNPHVYGGSMDTMGCKPTMDLPDLPGANEHSAETIAKLRQIPDSAPQEARYSVLREAAKSAPGGADYATMFETSEYKEVEKQRAHDIKLNKKKKERAAVLHSGGHVNMRRDRCEGDPVI